MGLPEDIYAAIDCCETAQEIWLRVQQMMKGSNIGIQEKNVKLFNEWESFISTDGESIESYYHHLSKLINNFKRNKHFPENIASNLKFLNNLQPELSRHVTIVHQTKDLHEVDYTQLYDFLKYNQVEQLEKDEFQEEGSMEAFWVINKRFQQFIDSQFTLDYDSQMTEKYFAEYTGIKMQTQESKVNLRKALDAGLVVTESSGTEFGKQDTSSRPENDAEADNADIRPVYDKEPVAEVQLTAEYNIFAIGQQHTEQPEIINEGRESAFVKPDHVIASSESKNSSKNMPRFCSNDMVHNYYLEEARKKTQERNRNSKSSMMHTASPQITTNGSKPKPRSNNQTSRSLLVSKSSCATSNVVPLVDHSRNPSPFSDSKHFVCSTCQKCVFNTNHDACITKFLREVNLRAKIQSHKTRSSNKPVTHKSHTQKPVRQIFPRHRFSPNKTSAVYEKTSPRSDLRWKPTGRILKTVGLWWIPTGKSFDSSTRKVDNEPSHGSNVDISKIHKCKQTLDLSACTSSNVQKKQSIDLSAGTSYNVNKENLRV
ncbi:hypothetical protein Tco_0975205 [Tanacetum coccineum]|uniref:Uncharacterized protein n=1 Tax=Tanacetum coccineum TaxID=301880 RepID=A0ABQ5EDR5_9ASTR